MQPGDRVAVKATGEQGQVELVTAKRVFVSIDGAVGNPWPFYPSELEVVS